MKNADLARAIGVDPATITHFFGQSRSSSIVERICRHFGWPVPSDELDEEIDSTMREARMELGDDEVADILAWVRTEMRRRKKGDPTVH